MSMLCCLTVDVLNHILVFAGKVLPIALYTNFLFLAFTLLDEFENVNKFITKFMWILFGIASDI